MQSDTNLPTLFPVIEVDLPQWTDLALPAVLINPAGSLAPPVFDTADGTLLFRNGQTDIVTFQFQLPHSYKEGTDVSFHIHWSKTTSAAGTVNWQAQFSWCNIGAVTPGFGALSPGTAVVSDGDTAELHAIRDFVNLPGSGMKVSSIVKVILERVSAAGGDTYAANARLISADLHFMANTFGSLQEWVKV